MSSMTKVVRHPKKGRCLIATRDIQEGELIAHNHVELVTYALIESSELAPWSFAWNDDHDAIVFGDISLVNHSEDPNSRLERDFDQGTISCFAKRQISEGEEITYSYACDLWFDPVE